MQLNHVASRQIEQLKLYVANVSGGNALVLKCLYLSKSVSSLTIPS
jgi:hypothetical protein